MNPNKRKQCFELFGFDFLLDEDFRIWLIEINSNPYLGTPNKDMVQLVPRMVNQMLEIVLDPHFPPQNDCKQQSNFQLIYKEADASGGAINLRRPYSQDLLYPIPSLKPPVGKIEKPKRV